MHIEDITIGDSVELKSNGKQMTVTSIQKGKNTVTCEDDNHIKNDYQAEDLTPYWTDEEKEDFTVNAPFYDDGTPEE